MTSSPLSGLAGSYDSSTFLTDGQGQLVAVLSRLTFFQDGSVVSGGSVAYVGEVAGLQPDFEFGPSGSYSLEGGELIIPGTSTFDGQLALDRLSYSGTVAGAGGAGEQRALLTDPPASVAGAWTGTSLATAAFPGQVNLTPFVYSERAGQRHVRLQR